MRRIRRGCRNCSSRSRRLRQELGGMPAQMLEGLCEKFMPDEGFFTRCMASSLGGYAAELTDQKAFCARLHKECVGKWPAERSLRARITRIRKLRSSERERIRLINRKFFRSDFQAVGVTFVWVDEEGNFGECQGLIYPEDSAESEWVAGVRCKYEDESWDPSGGDAEQGISEGPFYSRQDAVIAAEKLAHYTAGFNQTIIGKY